MSLSLFRNHFSRCIVRLVAGALLFSSLLNTARAGAPVHVLIVGQYIPNNSDPGWPKLQAACLREGVDLEVLSPDNDFPLYTSDVLKKFEVVVVCGLPAHGSQNGQPESEAAAFRDRLGAYYRSGGGVMWTPLGFMENAADWTKLIGSRYDVRALPEALCDPSKMTDINPTYRNPLFTFIWTTNVTPAHPVTEGVRGLLMPTTGEWSWPGTEPMKFGPSWTVLVRGMDTTSTMGNSAPAGSGQSEFKPEIKGSYTSDPEIVGAREAAGGSGRMMVFPFHTTYTLLNFHHIAFNDAMMLNGDGVHVSDGMRLFVNGCKWLAEPAQKAGLGGYQPPAAATAGPLPSLDWSKAAFEGASWSGMGSWWDGINRKRVNMNSLAMNPEARDFKGIVGVRTSASDGRGSVADDVAAAKAQGLSFIVFLENVEKCTDAGYAKTVADCKAATTPDFVAIPGFIYRDKGGNLQFDYDVDRLPLPDNLTPDRRVIAPNDITDESHWINGHGIGELGKLKVDLTHLFLFSAIAPYVYDGGRLTDDGLSKYIYSEGLGHQYAPVSLDIIRSPAELTAAARSEHLTVIHVDKLSDIKMALSREADHPRPVYLTNGPVITRWGVLNPIGQPFWAGANRMRLALEANSPAGITDVKIIDASTGGIYRHFKPGGAKNFACSIDESHKQQWRLVPVITDAAGHTAVGSGLITFQDANRTWMMGDRLMGMDHSLGWNADHTSLVSSAGWLGGILWVKPYFTAGAYPPNPRWGELKIHGIDGGEIHPAAIDIEPEVVTDAGTEPKVPAWRFKSVLASFDYSIMDYVGDRQFLVDKRKIQKKSGWWETPDPEVPNQIADITARTWAVRARAMASVSANVHEITVTFKRDVTLDRLQLAGLRSGGEQVTPMIFAKDRQGEYAWLVNPGDHFDRQGIMDMGGYLFPSNYRGGAVGVVNLGPVPITYACNGQTSRIYVAGDGRSFKAGDKLKVRFLTFMRAWEDQTNNQWLKQFISDYGIGCKPGYTYQVTQGKVRQVDYALDLSGSNGGATLEVGKYNLPHDLVVRVNGIPPNAIAGRYDLTSRQLLLLAVVENTVGTSIDTRLGDTHLYAGELFHCDDPKVRLSAVQDGNDRLLLEVHNPTETERTVHLTAAPGFAPLAGMNETIKIAPYSSEKRTLTAAAGSLDAGPYRGD